MTPDLTDVIPDDEDINYEPEPDGPPGLAGDFPDFDEDPDTGDPSKGTVIPDPDQEDDD